MRFAPSWFLIALFAVPALAQEQDVPIAEVLLGPSYLHQGSLDVAGWHAALNANWNYSLRAGPQFTFIRNRCCTAFTHGLLGGTWVSSAGHAGLVTATIRESGFSAAVGPGLDLNINDNLAWRLFQADYSFFRIFGQASHGFRISTGIVLKFD